MKLAFEKSILNALYPVFYRRDKKMMHIESDEFKYSKTYERNFNFGVKHFMMINVVHDIIKLLHFEQINNGFIHKGINKPTTYKNIKKVTLNNNLNELFEDYNLSTIFKEEKTITTTYKKITEYYPFIGEIIKGPRKMIEVFDQINNSFFNLDLNLHYFNEANKFSSLKFSTMDKQPTKLFSIKSIFTKETKNHHLKDVSFEINFNYFYSHIMSYGIYNLNLRYISEQIYTANISELSKLFYILFLASGRIKKEPIGLFKIIDKIYFFYTTLKEAEGKIISILNELKEYEFIKSYELIGKSIRKKRIKIDYDLKDKKY